MAGSRMLSVFLVCLRCASCVAYILGFLILVSPSFAPSRLISTDPLAHLRFNFNAEGRANSVGF